MIAVAVSVQPGGGRGGLLRVGVAGLLGLVVGDFEVLQVGDEAAGAVLGVLGTLVGVAFVAFLLLHGEMWSKVQYHERKRPWLRRISTVTRHLTRVAFKVDLHEETDRI